MKSHTEFRQPFLRLYPSIFDIIISKNTKSYKRTKAWKWWVPTSICLKSSIGRWEKNKKEVTVSYSMSRISKMNLRCYIQKNKGGGCWTHPIHVSIKFTCNHFINYAHSLFVIIRRLCSRSFSDIRFIHC